MDKKKAVAFMKFLNIKLNAEDLAEINGDESPVEPMVEETPEPVVQAATPETAPALVANAFPPQTQAPAAPAAPAQAPMPPVAQPSNIPMLDALINEMGGFEAFKAVMLKCLEMGQAGGAQTPQPQQQPYPNKQRDDLTVALLASSRGALTKADLDGMSDAVLLKMNEALKSEKPNQPPVDFGALGLSTNAARKQTPAPRPSILLRETAQ